MGGDRGLYDKYNVFEGSELVTRCFVLEPGTDPAAREALRAYADATDNEALEADLRCWLRKLEADDG